MIFSALTVRMLQDKNNWEILHIVASKITRITKKAVLVIC